MYTFDATDKSFHVLMVQSDWRRSQTVVAWHLWNLHTISMTMFAMNAMSPDMASCNASCWDVVKTYKNTVGAMRQEQADDTVRFTDIIIIHWMTFFLEMLQMTFPYRPVHLQHVIMIII